MKKIILVFLITFFPFIIWSQSNPFKDLKYDEVIAYEFQGNGEQLISTCLKEDKSKINKSVTLSKNQISSIENILTSNSSYGNTTASCFDPHFAIVYYFKGEIIETIDICLECNYLISTKDIPATNMKMIKISDDYSYPAKGFSKTARKSIYEFCIKLNFNEYLKPLNSFFD